jgi:hypothetical protein
MDDIWYEESTEFSRYMFHQYQDFFNQFENEPAYEAEDTFHEPFYDFMYRYQSLQRHWWLNKRITKQHTLMLQNALTDMKNTTEFDGYYDILSTDIEYFPEYTRYTTIAIALSLVENMLNQLSISVAADLGKPVILEQNNMPYINKYLFWLTHTCGLSILIDADTWKSINTIRKVRNSFIHQISKDIPDDIKKVINEMLESMDANSPINDEFVDIALVKLAALVKTIELAYLDFYKKLKKSP